MELDLIYSDDVDMLEKFYEKTIYKEKTFGNYMDEKIVYIKIPSFSENFDKQLNEVIEIMPNIRNKKIVFDLRGNMGGDNNYCIKILENYTVGNIF